MLSNSDSYNKAKAERFANSKFWGHVIALSFFSYENKVRNISRSRGPTLNLPIVRVGERIDS